MDFEPSEMINCRERFRVSPRLEPPIDLLLSKLLGKKIFANDPRLLKLIVKWKKGKSPDSMEPDNFMQTPKFVEELKQLYA